MTTRLPAGVSPWRPDALIATGLGTGFLPIAPGTWGSAATLPLGWVLYLAGGAVAVAAGAGVAFLVGWWASASLIRTGGAQDPGYIVIDEVAGQLLALAVVPANPWLYLLAFLGFRLADIVKPWPAGWADRTVKGGLGIMLDDVLAALYVAIILYGVVAYLGMTP